MIDGARKPLIMAGHGVILSGAFEPLRRLAEKTGVPVITTLLGISSFPESHPLSLGMPGMHGAASTNRAREQAGRGSLLGPTRKPGTDMAYTFLTGNKTIGLGTRLLVSKVVHHRKEGADNGRHARPV